MIFCEHTISEYTANGKALYNVTLVYRIGSKGKELVAQLTVDVEAREVSLDSLGAEFTYGQAEANRIWKLKRSALINASQYATLCKVDGRDNFYRHVDYRK